MSGMFKSKQVTPTYQSTPQDDRINQLWGMVQPKVQDYINTQAGKAYTGEMVAPLTSMENQNLSRLQDYLNSPYASDSAEFGMAKKEIANIFGDEYNPWKSGGELEYTQNRLKKYLTEDLLPATRTRASGTGSLYSSGFVDEESNQVADVMDQMAKYAYDAENKWRESKQAAIPMAMQIGEYATQEPLQRLMNTMGLAGYERTNYSQPLDTAKQQDYLRMAQELQGLMGTGVQLSGQSGGTLAYPSYQPSTFERYIMPLINSGVTLASANMLSKKG